MQLRLRTKLTLMMTSLVLLVAAVLSGVFAAQLLDQLLQETMKRANDIADQLFPQAQLAVTVAGEQGLRPASDSPEEIRDYVRHAFENQRRLAHSAQSRKEESADLRDFHHGQYGMVLIFDDENLPGKFLPRRAPLSQMVQRNFLHQVKVLVGLRRSRTRLSVH